MIKVNDLNSVETINPLTFELKNLSGETLVHYNVKPFNKLSNLRDELWYRIECTQILRVNNNYPYIRDLFFKFEDYPAMVSNSISCALDEKPKSLYIKSYWPKTLNSAVSVAKGTGTGSEASQEWSRSSGSSNSQTNSYGVSVSGLFSFGANADHSSTESIDSSSTAGGSASTNSSTDTNASMSIKDWAANVSMDSDTKLTWCWGQEYPWNLFEFRSWTNAFNSVLLPQYVQNRMMFYDGPEKQVFVRPPSDLSQFGFDFSMKAVLEVKLSDLPNSSISLKHEIALQTASHGQREGAYFTVSPWYPVSQFNSPELNLPVLGLDPISVTEGESTGAVIGFAPNKFIVPPTAGNSFKIMSSSNNLYVIGEGFSDDMNADFSGPAKLQIGFKITDPLLPINLYLKCWKTTDVDIYLNFSINGIKLQKLVANKEGRGDDSNVVKIDLRNNDFTSIDYHDYLQLGYNQIDVSIEPHEVGPSGFFLRAVAIDA